MIGINSPPKHLKEFTNETIWPSNFFCKKTEMNSLALIDIQFSSVQFSCSVVSDSLQPHELQHTRPPCPSPTPRVHSDSCPSSPWCHPAISSSVVPFSSCPQSLPASESFPMSQLFTWGGQSTGVSAIASFLPKNTQGWSCSPRDSQESSPTPQFKSINSSVLNFLHSPTLTSIHDHSKNHSLDETDLCCNSGQLSIGLWSYPSKHNRMYDSIRLHR